MTECVNIIFLLTQHTSYTKSKTKQFSIKQQITIEISLLHDFVQKIPVKLIQGGQKL